jgi:hypothetical protein
MISANELGTMTIETKYLRLATPAALGDQIEGWRVCWLGGWDKGRIRYVVMGMRVQYGRASDRNRHFKFC